MLSYQWQDRAFAIESLNSRRPVDAGDELVIIACPDPPGAEDCLRAVRQVRGRGGRGGGRRWPLATPGLAPGGVPIGAPTFLHACRLARATRPPLTPSLVDPLIPLQCNAPSPTRSVTRTRRRAPPSARWFCSTSGSPGARAHVRARPRKPVAAAAAHGALVEAPSLRTTTRRTYCCARPDGISSAAAPAASKVVWPSSPHARRAPILTPATRLPPFRSGDVGIGLNARRMRNNFLNNFTVTYSLRPVGDIGTVFRRYPGMWKVFIEEPDLPGRCARRISPVIAGGRG